jgi:hypothetical protein
MARLLLAVCVVVLCSGLTYAAQPKCNSNKSPGQPWNTLLTENSYQAGSPKAKLTMTWRSPVQGPGDGCLDGYRVDTFSNGRLVKSDRLMADPLASPMRHTTEADPGQTVNVKIVAFNSAAGKESAPAEVATIKAAGNPVRPVPL